MKGLSRREFLRASTLATAATIAAACTPSEPTTPDVSSQPVAAPELPAQPAAPPSELGTVVFSESPMLAELVETGQLPPIEQRLPENPCVYEGLDGIGNHGGTMRRAFQGQADTSVVYTLLNRGLLDVLGPEMSIRPSMCESWSVSEDATTYTFHLRKGIRWSDGEPMTNEDYRFYYEDQILNRELTGQQPVALSYVVSDERIPATFATVDDWTITYEFAGPNSLFYLWGGVLGGIPARPAHYYKKYHVEYVDKDVLAKMISDARVADWTELYWDKDNYIFNIDRPVHYAWVPKTRFSEEFLVYERNPYFWEVDPAGKQLPYLDKVTFRLFADRQVAMMWAINGEIDCQLRHFDLPEQYAPLKQGEQSGEYRVLRWRSSQIYGSYYNLTAKVPRVRELFQERDFRIACSLAVDRDELREMVIEGLGRNTQIVPPPESPLHYPKLANAYLEYDPDRANELLDNLGYTERDSEGFRLWKDGSGERISFANVSRHGAKAPVLDLMLTDYLEDIGLQMVYKGVERALTRELWYSNETEVEVGTNFEVLFPLRSWFNWVLGEVSKRGWGNAWGTWVADPTDPIAEEPPKGHWSREIWDKWLAIQSIVGEEEQKQAFWEILDIWAEELPAIGYFTDAPLPVICKNGFRGIQEGFLSDNGPTNYENFLNGASWYWDDPAKHS